MSESKVPTIIQDPTSDLTPVDMIEVNNFIEAGLPALATISDIDLARMAELYLEGKTYGQLSRIFKIDPAIPMYLSHRGKWFTKRLRHKQELSATIQGRLMDAQLEAQDHLLHLQQHFQKKLRLTLDRFDKTGDSSLKPDLKEIEKYLKVLDMLQKGVTPKAPKTPPVGINVGNGIVITKTGDSAVEISPKDKTIAQMMADIANNIRNETSDIKQISAKEGDKNEESS